MRPHERITPSSAIFNLPRIICNKYCCASYDIILVSFKGNKKTRQTLERSSFPVGKRISDKEVRKFQEKEKKLSEGWRKKKKRKERKLVQTTFSDPAERD